MNMSNFSPIFMVELSGKFYSLYYADEEIPTSKDDAIDYSHFWLSQEVFLLKYCCVSNVNILAVAASGRLSVLLGS